MLLALRSSPYREPGFCRSKVADPPSSLAFASQVQIAADDDSDIDVDLSEGDSAPAPRRAQRSTYEDDDEVDFDSDEAGSEGFIDLSTFLADGQGYDVPSDSEVESGDEAQGESTAQDGMDMEDEEEDDDEDLSDEDVDEDEDEDDGADRLTSFISGLPSKRKSAPGESDEEDGAAGSSRVKRRVLKDRNEEGRKEGSFGAPLNTSTSGF